MLMGMGGSMSQTWTSFFPSLLAVFPEKMARPLGGVFPMSLRRWIMRSSASMTLFRVCALLMLLAVPCSCWRWLMILLRSYSAGT